MVPSMKNLFFAALQLLLTPSAFGGWYQVENYVGHIGSYPVHVSIQEYDFGSGLTVEGSYYYDKHMTAIPIYGKYDKKLKSISLCEIHNDMDFQNIIVRGSETGFETANCPFQLIQTKDSMTGKWVSNGLDYDVLLQRVGSLSNTESGVIMGDVEIPFWGQTKNYMFVGIYESTGKGISINKVRVINKLTKQVVQEFDPQKHDCSFGFFMTPIYMNIENAMADEIMLNCYGPRSGTLAYYGLDKKNGQFKFLYMR